VSGEPEDTRDGISRRQALKRMAAAGAVAWAAPAVQTMNMRRAWAQNESPIRICHRIKTNGERDCEEGFGAQDCLDPATNFTGEDLQPCTPTPPGCCAFYVSTSVSPCEWTVTVAPECIIVGATAKTGGPPTTQRCFGFAGSGSNSITVNTCELSRFDISHVELAICCEETATLQTLEATTGASGPSDESGPSGPTGETGATGSPNPPGPPDPPGPPNQPGPPRGGGGRGNSG